MTRPHQSNRATPRAAQPPSTAQSAAMMPLFTKTHDFLAWLVQVTNNFPRAHRHTVTNRLLGAGFDFLEKSLAANRQRGHIRAQLLDEADGFLDRVRHYLLLAHGWNWLSAGQYAHGSRMVAEMGRLLGGWKKITDR